MVKSNKTKENNNIYIKIKKKSKNTHKDLLAAQIDNAGGFRALS
jgi:hypothetical protein